MVLFNPHSSITPQVPMLENYRAHVAERAALGIPPLPRSRPPN